AQREQVESLQELQHVSAKASKKDVAFEMLALDLFFQRLSKVALPADHEPGVRHGADDDCRSVNQMLLAFLGDERADVADDRSMCRQVEGGVDVRRLELGDALDVHAFVNNRSL